MGSSVSQCNGQHDFTNDLLVNLADPAKIHEITETKDNYKPGCLSAVSIYHKDDPDRTTIKNLFQKDFKLDDLTADRAFGSFLGMPIGDALGAPFEFSKVTYDAHEMKDGFSETGIWKKNSYNRFDLHPGQWTDDASMGLALADSLLVNKDLAPRDLRHRFVLWWSMGYCNAFGYDSSRKYKSSVGLGGNISESMSEFMNDQTDYTKAGDNKTSGNGSVMRNAAIPIFFLNDPVKALEAASNQSRTTHQGDEAAECCRLLTHIVINAIKGSGTKEVLANLSTSFSSPEISVQCLAESKAEDPLDQDRDWDWKSPKFKYSPTRASSQPGYIGSYAMDAMAMALHCVWTTNSFKEALLKCANIRGDSDSVSSVAGQIAGAIYGLHEIPKDWVQAVLKWDPNWDILLRAYKLYNRNGIYKTKEEGVGTAEGRKVVVETPKEVVETPKEVVETPKDVVETPKDVVETPKEESTVAMDVDKQ